MGAVLTPLTPDTALDERLMPGYYISLAGLAPGISDLLARCGTVFDVKPLMVAALDDAGASDLGADRGGSIAAGAHVEGDVFVQAGARVEAGARVVGPVLVCAGAVIGSGAYVRDHTIVGPGCQIGFGAEVTRSLLVEGVFAKHACFIGDSVVGRHVNFAVFSSTTGLLTDGGPVVEPAVREIAVRIDGRRVGSGQTKFGAVLGDDVTVSAGTVLSPGTLLGPRSYLYPRTQVGGFVPAGSQVR